MRASVGGLPVLAVLRAVGARPRLWPVALRQVRALAPAGWWRRRPFLPVPARDYLAFRLQTMYGGEPGVTADAADVVRWLEWARRERPGRRRFRG